MANFFADWKNSVLVITVAGTLVFGYLWVSSIPSTVIIVGNHSFSEKDVVKTLKDTTGFVVVKDMVTNALFEEYAAGLNVSVTDSEVDQLLNFNKRRLELQGQSLDQLLAAQGITLPTFRKTLSAQALQTKLLLTPKEMQSAVNDVAKDGKPPFTVPPRYKYRLFSFADEKSAQEAYAEIMQNPEENAEQVALESLNPAMAKQDMIYIPGLAPKTLEKFLNPILTSLKPGQSSKPSPVPGANKAQFVFFLLKEIEPEVKPTYENSNISAGYYYYFPKNAQTLSKRMQDLEGKALDKSMPQFFKTDYDMVKTYFEDLRKRNPQLPPVPSSMDMPMPAPTPAPGKAEPPAGK